MRHAAPTILPCTFPISETIQSDLGRDSRLGVSDLHAQLLGLCNDIDALP